MSKENHPNIHAVKVTIELINSINSNLRGDAGKHKMEVMSKIFSSKTVVDFVADLSLEIDDICDGLESE